MQGGPGTCPQPAREIEIPSAFGNLQNAIERLGGTVGELLERLKPISREEPAGKQPEGPAEALSTPLARQLRNHQNQIDELNTVLQDQLRRLEI